MAFVTICMWISLHSCGHRNTLMWFIYSFGDAWYALTCFSRCSDAGCHSSVCVFWLHWWIFWRKIVQNIQRHRVETDCIYYGRILSRRRVWHMFFPEFFYLGKTEQWSGKILFWQNLEIEETSVHIFVADIVRSNEYQKYKCEKSIANWFLTIENVLRGSRYFFFTWLSIIHYFASKFGNLAWIRVPIYYCEVY